MRWSIVALLCFGLSSAMAGTSSTAFTFQGRLDDTGLAANGVYDFEFEPFDADIGSGSLAPSLQIDNISVQDGVFTVLLDFGDSPFVGNPVFLEVRVKADADPLYSTLTPRQAVTSAPYAIQAEFVAANAIGTTEIIDNSVGAADIDSTQVQRRVSSVCASGEAIRAINDDGSVQCEMSGGSFWMPGATNALEPDRSVRIQPGTVFPFVVRHGSNATDPHIAITDTADSQPARLSFYNDARSFVVPSDPRLWTISGSITADPVNDRLNFFSRDAGDLLSLTGDGLVGIDTTSPDAPLHIASDDNWFWGVGNGRGDMYIGDGSVGMSFGVALSGGGRGASRIWTKGGAEELRLGTEVDGDTLVINQGSVAVGSSLLPQRELDVDGDVRIRGLTHAGPGTRQLLIEPDGDVVSSASQTQYYSMSMTAFGPENNDQTFFRNGQTFRVIGTGSQSISAPVNLPHGARVTGVTVWFEDNDSGVDADMTFLLRYFDHVTNMGFGPMAVITSSGASPDTQMLSDTSIFADTIDNENRNYMFQIFSTEWNSNFVIRSVRISYVN